jgi:3-(3-hydroxy-phenyl)propionate hydroxylase
MMPPFQGQGMNSGLRDAANLSWKLAAVLNGALGDEILDTYDEERREHAKAMIEISRRVGALLMTRNALLARLRDLAFVTLSKIPRASAYLRQMGFKPKPHSNTGYFLPDETGWPGRLFSQPEVIGADAQRVRLDNVLGDGFSLLHIADGPSDAFAEFSHPLWRRLNARRVLAIPGGLKAAPLSADAVVGDLGSTLARAINGAGPLTLLLRPDRYVCATIKPGMADVIAGRLDMLAPVTPAEQENVLEAAGSSSARHAIA